ncbi:flagellar operon protein [Caldicellulosiruptor acetigenus I77R1B]|jgi:flagellar operon protein|uniref:Flagellar operon protein n=2 Tax=Caldicellulosiruptor acetigenus TaxID=301953 RepID=G2PUW9_9FIRM|nr:TIGR02530 family flagellar biosynthesis protein [Caldicellulosiruptor acetigenus]ADQ39965.1 flagellar operon protein [Caldicellulosiruptor acetigenus I77R1B]AEM74521.1 flagellar operon protein [Caldicellulosiruptor acetigenus 6A]WAM36780.1 flagellar biosynthesis protein [Caldicellulosiruptor acetigenus]
MAIDNVRRIITGGQSGYISNVTKQATENFASILSQTLKISKHANERLKLQNIDLDEATLDKLEQAVKKAEQKGLKNDVLVLNGNKAYIVNIKNKVVVTVKDVSGLKDNIFTNIDGVLMI